VTTPDETEPELTAEEARDLANDLGLQLYRAQDALAFVEECCVIADREQKPVTTADVREWLKGARCGRQLAADAREQTALRDRITARLTPFFANFSDEDAARANAEEAATALLPTVITHTDRATVLREEAALIRAHCPDHLDATSADGSWINCHCDVADDLERRADDENPGEAKPWLSDSARIGRALIWSWTDIGKGAFGEGYRAAQAEARALLGGQRGTDATPTKEA
jgi:hypothetical protein